MISLYGLWECINAGQRIWRKLTESGTHERARPARGRTEPALRVQAAPQWSPRDASGREACTGRPLDVARSAKRWLPQSADGLAAPLAQPLRQPERALIHAQRRHQARWL